MANQILMKRGLETNRAGVTPAAGEPLWTTDDKKLYIGDGATAGGILVGAGSYSWTITGDTGTEVVAASEEITFAGGTSITTAYDTGTNTLTITGLAYTGGTGITLNAGAFDHDAHTGEVTGATALTITNSAVTLAKMAALPDQTIIGNDTGASATPQALTKAEVLTLLNVADGADVTSTNETTHADVLVDGDFTANGFMKRTGVGTYTVDTVSYLPLTGGTISSNLIIQGDLTVNGTTTTLNTTELLVEDNLITVNSGETGVPSLNAGMEVERGTSTNVAIRWNETTDKWQTTNDGTTYYDLITTDTVAASHNHDATYLKIADIDDAPVNGELNAPISSNWAFDHAGGADPHTVYPLQAGTESITGTWTWTNATFDGGTF